MKQFIAILVFTVCLATSAKAQTFLNDLHKSKPGEGKITVTQSADIDNLVNNAKLKYAQEQASKQKAGQNVVPQDDKDKKNKTHVPADKKDHHTAATEKKENHTAAPNKNTAGEHHRGDSTEHKNPSAEANNTHRSQDRQPVDSQQPVDTSKKMMRNSRKVTGYRIQAYSGGNSRADREKANRIGNDIKMKYPDQPVYVHFYSPRWICRVGNFRSYGEAEQILRGIKAMGYKQACIVKGKITVAY